MKTMFILILIFTNQTGVVADMERIHIPYDTRVDCNTTARIITRVPGIYSADCMPMQFPESTLFEPIKERGV